ncbi:MAG: NifU family protein [Bacteroidia bacterium]|nr:NifU family protein [Bacteroidia bacterium]
MAIDDIGQARQIIERSLEDMRPHFREDGGDIMLVDVDHEGIVEVRFLGECAQCPMALMTLRAGVERLLMLALPGIKRIEMV